MRYPEDDGRAVAPYETVEPDRGTAVAAWEPAENGLTTNFSGVHLGARIGRDGWNAGYKDTHEQLVLDAALRFGVGQSSGGSTYVYAIGCEGYTVESLNPDASSPRSLWRNASPRTDKVTVDSDWGKFGTLEPGVSFKEINFGNPGVRSGIVRVTAPDGTQRFYLMAADFRGKPDDWRVHGLIREIKPNEALLQTITPQPLGAAAVQATISHELVPVSGVGRQLIDDLSLAFAHETSMVDILHAPEDEAKAAAMFAGLTAELLLEIARHSADLFIGQERAIDELGRRARLVTNAPLVEKGYLHSFGTDQENFTRYFEGVKGAIYGRRINGESAHNFTFFTNQAFSILHACFSSGQGLALPSDNKLLSMLETVIMRDQDKTAAILAERKRTLAGTLLDPESSAETSHAVALPGQNVVINLQDMTPLLRKDQTRAAFQGNPIRSGRYEESLSWSVPVIAFLTIGGKRYALTDSGTQSQVTGRYKDVRTFTLMQLTGEPEDLRRGQHVTRREYTFGDTYGEPMPAIFDSAKAGDKGHPADIGAKVTMHYSERDQTLTLRTDYVGVGVTTAPGEVTVKSWQADDREPLDFQRKLIKWQNAVLSVERQTARLRENLERNIVRDGDPVKVAQHQAKIDEIVARGPERSWTYNGSRGDKWGRSQAYHVTVDGEGNIWGEYLPVNNPHEIGITGKPHRPGKYIIHANPRLNRGR